MKKFFPWIIVFILACTLFIGCAASTEVMAPTPTVTSTPGTITGTFIHNGMVREYILYVPEDLPKDSPLVIGMHGYTSSAWTFKNNFGWDKVAEENKFIMCYPQGTNEAYSGASHWNARLNLSTVDDVGFICDLALYLADEYQLDKDRIFATGFSNGGFMAYSLACERPDVFRAVASVSGLMSGYTWASYNPYNLSAEEWLEFSQDTPIPVCHIHGTADRVIAIDGTTPYPIWSGGPSADELVRFWVGINKCSEVNTVNISQNVTATYYTNPDNENQVWYIEYEGWSHYWPSMDYEVNKPSEINAQDIIWEFFSLYK